MSGENTSSRTRNVGKDFILLRTEDTSKRKPSKGALVALEACGRVKRIQFSNNATSDHVAEILLEKFPNHINRGNIDR